MGHERGVLVDITEARSAALKAGTINEKIAAENRLSAALDGLKVSVEAYPDLKASQNFMDLQTEISDIENNEVIEKVLQEYLALVFRYINKENMKHEDVRQLINNNFKPAKALRLYQFFKGYYFEPDEKYQIKKGLNASTIWRYKRDLKNIGVSFEENLGDSNFVSVEELVIPSDKGIFGLLDYKLSSHYS